MIKSFFISLLLLIPLFGFTQVKDSLAEPLISLEKQNLLKNINITFDMRMEF